MSVTYTRIAYDVETIYWTGTAEVLEAIQTLLGAENVGFRWDSGIGKMCLMVYVARDGIFGWEDVDLGDYVGKEVESLEIHPPIKPGKISTEYEISE
jgi:hypothetical protein